MTIALLVLAVFVVYFVLTYNSLAHLRLLARNAWADIDVQLKRRHDLIPQLVQAVKGHAGYERGTLESVVAARGRAMSAAGPAASAPAEGALAESVRSLLAVAEAYPDLKAGESFLTLQRSLTEIEDHVQDARRYYNAVVRDYNTKIAQFPSSLVAGIARFSPAEFFGLDDRAEGQVPQVALGLVFLLLLPWSSASAQRTLDIESFNAVILVNRDASINVTEMITARFTGQWNGIYRTIPVEYRTPQGFNWTIRLDDQAATDLEGQPLRLETSRERHYVKHKIWVPGATNVTKAVALRYVARNGLRFFEDHDELYWNVTGDEWDVPIETASAVITLPEGAANVRATAFNGAYGSTARDAKVAIDGRTVRVDMPKRLEFREGLTVVVGWDKGAVVAPTQADKAAGFLSDNWPLALPIPVFAGMLALWFKRGRDPRRRPIAVQYEPPDGMTPAEAGALMDYTADMRDITATVVDLAVRGYLKIEEVEDPVLFGLFHRDDFLFRSLRPRAEWRDLQPHERRVLEGLFEDGGSDVRLSALKNEFYTHLPGIKDAMMDRLIEKRLYTGNPTKTRGRWMGLALGLAFLTVVLGVIVSNKFGVSFIAFLAAAVVNLLIVAIIGYHMPARTEPGARALEKLLGFSEFLSRVDREKYEHVIKTPEMFERFLPYAMAFGVESRWARAFDGIYREPPRWYGGSNFSSFNAGAFSSRLSAMSSRAGDMMSSSPRSSSGSGFSGGSSGGGGGGGGGGGF